MAYVTGIEDIAGRRDPAISPLFAALRGMPPAAFIAGTGDPLFDDTRLMHEKWSAAAPADLVVVPEAAHGFDHFGGRAGEKVHAFVRAWVAERLNS
jgi:acetyl esterase/lipase